MASGQFAARLRELRTEAGMSQKELADKAGMTKDGIAQLEQGRRSPSWETALTLASALGVEIGAFTIPPKDAPAPQRGRPRKASAPEDKQGKVKPAAKSKKKAK